MAYTYIINILCYSAVSCSFVCRRVISVVIFVLFRSSSSCRLFVSFGPFVFIAVIPTVLAGIINNIDTIFVCTYFISHDTFISPVLTFTGERRAWWKSVVPLSGNQQLINSSNYFRHFLGPRDVAANGSHFYFRFDLGFTICRLNPTVFRYFSTSNDILII